MPLEGVSLNQTGIVTEKDKGDWTGSDVANYPAYAHGSFAM